MLGEFEVCLFRCNGKCLTGEGYRKVVSPWGTGTDEPVFKTRIGSREERGPGVSLVSE